MTFHLGGHRAAHSRCRQGAHTLQDDQVKPLRPHNLSWEKGFVATELASRVD